MGLGEMMMSNALKILRVITVSADASAKLLTEREV
jgi:hypothetical protein